MTEIIPTYHIDSPAERERVMPVPGLSIDITISDLARQVARERDIELSRWFCLERPGDHGYTLRAAIESPVTLWPGDHAFVTTGVCGRWPASIAPVLLPRSGNGAKLGMVLGNIVGLIDASYEGELICAVWHRGTPGESREFTINPGDKMFQCVFMPVAHPAIRVVDDLPAVSERGAGGFGSTGAA